MGSSSFNAAAMNAYNREQAKKHFLAKGRSYTEGYLFAKKGRGRLYRLVFLDSEYEGARDALAEFR